MKKFTLLFTLLLFTINYQLNAQSIIIGTGTDETLGYEADPIHGYYNAFRYQVVYTATELSASLIPYDEVTGLGFSISGDYAGGDLLGYTIKMGHTSATDSGAHDTSSATVVKGPFNYDPSVTAVGVFDMIAFDTNFVWNGVDNVLVDICSDGPNAYTAPYGQVRTTSGFTNGSRYYRIDGGSACGAITSSLNSNRPNIQFDYVDGTPPSCLPPTALTASSITATSAELGWTEMGTAISWDIEILTSTSPPTETATDTGVSNPFTTTTPLAADTLYYYYVRADCAAEGTTSTWAGPFSFRTPCETSTAVFFNDFESPINCWDVFNGGDASTWIPITESGNTFIAIFYNQFNAHDDYLVSPVFTVTDEVTDAFNFKGWNPNDTWPEVINVYVMNTAGDTILGTLATDLNLPTPAIGSEPTVFTYDLSFYEGMDVRIGFHSTTTNQNVAIIDDFTVDSFAVLGTESNTLTGFSLYPNPVNDRLHLTALDNIDELSIYNLLGQEVLRTQPKVLSTQIDMSNLPTGMYVVKVKVGQQLGSYRIIKE